MFVVYKIRSSTQFLLLLSQLMKLRLHFMDCFLIQLELVIQGY